MSSAAATINPPRSRELDSRPGLLRLAGVELRKMVDTRSGFWLILLATALTFVVGVVMLFVADDKDLTLRTIVSALVQPSAFLLPIIGILLVASEWSQRTTLVTFALVPDRRRVIGAKILAGLAMGVAALALTAVLGVIFTAIASPDIANTWSMPIELVVQVIVYVAVSMLIGVALGAALLTPAPAIVIYFALPFVIAALTSIPALDGIGPWLDQTQSLGPMTDQVLSGTEWAHAATTLGLWIGLPMAIGWYRITRGEVN